MIVANKRVKQTDITKALGISKEQTHHIITVKLLLVHRVTCRDWPPGPFATTGCCFSRVFSSIKSLPLSNFTYSKASITVYSFHSLVDDNCRTSFCSKKLDNRALFHKVVISSRRHFLIDRGRCTHIATSLIVNANDVT